MPSSKITSRGRVTIPKPIRDALGLAPGDRVGFRISTEGRVVLEAPTMDLMSLCGKLRPKATSLTLEEMDEAITDGANDF